MPPFNERYTPGRRQRNAKAVNYLIVANVIVFLLTWFLDFTNQADLYDILGLHHRKAELYQSHQLITHIFMHGGYFHIFINMFILWMFGSPLEIVWGTKRFLVFYFCTGLGAAFLHLAVTGISLNKLERETDTFVQNPSYERFVEFKEEHIDALPPRFANAADNFVLEWSADRNNPRYLQRAVSIVQSHLDVNINRPTVGASGAIYGLLIAFGILFPNVYIFLYFFFPIKAKYFVILLGAIELYSGLFGQNVSIANFAHLGGMIFGWALLKIWGDKAKPQPNEEGFAEVIED